MLFVIIALIILAVYLFITSGIITDIGEKEKNNIDTYEDKLLPGMLGSSPSDEVISYDDSKIIKLPTTEEKINNLLNLYKFSATTVYNDFSKNRNSTSYKTYIFYKYLLNLLYQNNKLTQTQITKFIEINNSISKKINEIIKIHLDDIKFTNYENFLLFQREIFDSSTNTFIITEKQIEDITNYVLSTTTIPNQIIFMLKYKLKESDRDIIDQLLDFSNYEYIDLLKTLEEVVVKEPVNGATYLNVKNDPTNIVDNNNNFVTSGFWSRVYYIFKNNNIDSFLISNIKLSFMSEEIYKIIIYAILSSIQNIKLIKSINNLINSCSSSKFTIIKNFPFNFTHSLIMDYINEKTLLMKIKKEFIYEQSDKLFTNVFDINNYLNIKYNFPVFLQNINVINSDATNSIDYSTDSNYHIIDSDNVINNNLFLPNINHKGIYFDRTDKVSNDNSGYIVITNTSTVDLKIENIIIHARKQKSFIEDDIINITHTISDSSIIDGAIEFKLGTYNYTNKVIDGTHLTITDKWLHSEIITLLPGTSIIISATKISSIIGQRYLRIMSIFISFAVKPSIDFLTISVVQDNSSTKTPNTFSFSKIPIHMNNLLFLFDSKYSILTPATLLTANKTSKILNDNLASTFSTIIIDNTQSDSSKLLLSSNSNAASAKSNYISSGVLSAPTIGNISGLLTDTQFFSMNPNNNHNSYRIKLKNNSTTIGNNIVIKKMILFGDIQGNNSNTAVNSISNILYDDYVLMRNNINVFTMNDKENEFDKLINPSFIIDTDNIVTTPDSYYIIEPGKSVFIEPNNIINISMAERYIIVRGMYLEVNKMTNTTIELSLIKLSPYSPNMIAAVNNNDILTGTSKNEILWTTNNNYMIYFNPINSTSTKYSPFVSSPEYVKNIYEKIESPSYNNDNPYHYYNDMSEMIPFSHHFY